MVDIIIDCSSETRSVLEQYVKNLLEVEITDYKNINNNFILVKELNDKKDLKLLKELNNLSYKYDLISIISSEKYILELLDLHKSYFIKKNMLKENLITIDECINNFKNSKSSYIDIISNYEHIIINIHSIIYIESYGHDVIIYTTTGEIKCRKKISMLFKELEYFGFIQVHKSYLVNIKYINTANSYEIILRDSTTLPIGRKFKSKIKSRLLSQKVH